MSANITKAIQTSRAEIYAEFIRVMDWLLRPASETKTTTPVKAQPLARPQPMAAQPVQYALSVEDRDAVRDAQDLVACLMGLSEIEDLIYVRTLKADAPAVQLPVPPTPTAGIAREKIPAPGEA